jgi:hypothetical protein
MTSAKAIGLKEVMYLVIILGCIVGDNNLPRFNTPTKMPLFLIDYIENRYKGYLLSFTHLN